MPITEPIPKQEDTIRQARLDRGQARKRQRPAVQPNLGYTPARGGSLSQRRSGSLSERPEQTFLIASSIEIEPDHEPHREGVGRRVVDVLAPIEPPVRRAAVRGGGERGVCCRS